MSASQACSVGIMAYNEEANITDAVTSVLGQQLTAGQITELIVVASGCEDRTTEIVAGLARSDPRVMLIEQERREGKASAINCFIRAAISPVLVMVGADTLVCGGAFDALLRHFEDPAVGMVGGHPLPVNSEATFLGHAVHLQWRLHDRIARQSPKLGEVVAFRNVVPGIPLDTAVDEISIQALISQLGYRLVYEPEAVVYNRGPTTVGDFLRQRRRIYAGHLRVREQQGYCAPTMSPLRAGRALCGSGSFAGPRAALWSIGAVGLEATARALGRCDAMRRRSSPVWEMCGTTKHHIAEGANAEAAIAVFHIVNFHRQQLEIGLRASRKLTLQAAEHIKRALGPAAIVTLKESGTVIALLPGDRAAAERTARELVRTFEAGAPHTGDRGAPAGGPLACGVVAFPPAGPPRASSIPVPVLEAGPAALLPGGVPAVALAKVLPEIPALKASYATGRVLGLPVNITVSVSYRCNSRCKTCNVWLLPNDDLTLPEWDRVFASLGRAPYWFTFSGGEPTLRSDLPDMVASAYRHCRPGIINIPTNGIQKKIIPGRVERVLQAAPRSEVVINLSLDGVGTRHDELRGVRNNWSHAMATYAALKELKTRYRHLTLGIHTVISTFNVDGFPELCAYVQRELKPDSYITEIAEERVELDTVGLGITPTAGAYTVAIDALLESMRDQHLTGVAEVTQAFRRQYYEIVKRTLREHRQVIPCLAGVASAQIAPNGDVWTCCVRAQSMGNLRDHGYDFGSVWRTGRGDQLRRSIKAGECYCPLANAAYTNMLMHGPTVTKVAAGVARSRAAAVRHRAARQGHTA